MPSYRLYAGGYEGKIVQLEFDPSRPVQERLRKIDEFECGKAPTWLTFSPDGADADFFTALQHADQSQDAHRSLHVVGGRVGSRTRNCDQPAHRSRRGSRDSGHSLDRYACCSVILGGGERQS